MDVMLLHTPFFYYDQRDKETIHQGAPVKYMIKPLVNFTTLLIIDSRNSAIYMETLMQSNWTARVVSEWCFSKLTLSSFHSGHTWSDFGVSSGWASFPHSFRRLG